jgi:hypothetical protein
MKLNSSIGDNAADWMKISTESVWDLIPEQCGPMTTCGAVTSIPACGDLVFMVDDDLRDDSEIVDDRRNKSLLDIDPSFDSIEKKEPVNDASSIAATRDSFHGGKVPPIAVTRDEVLLSPRPKNLPKGRFIKKAPVAPFRYPTPENAVTIADKKSTLSSFDAAARSNASWQRKMAALKVTKQQSQMTATDPDHKAEESVEERHEAPKTQQEQKVQKDSRLKSKPQTKQQSKLENIVEERRDEASSFDEQPKSIMKTSTPSARKEEKVKFHQRQYSDTAVDEMDKGPTPPKDAEEISNEYDSVGSLEDPPECNGVIVNMDQLHHLKNPDYHPVGCPKIICQKQQKKTKKPILGFFKRRKGDNKDRTGLTDK